MKRGLIFGLFLIVSISVQGQNGFLRGKIVDEESGEGLLGATVAQQGTSVGTTADFDGNYSLTLPEGIYTVEFRFFSYQTKTVSDIQIIADEVTSLDILLGESTTELAEVVVTAEQIRDNEVALLTVQKKSANTIDGISSAAFKKIGDSDLGGAMKRVTGVSVQGGKYIYVRGLGDRYTKTSVNGMSIPGLDPDRNAVQIDIFPTNAIENVVVFKTFTPDLQGDFGGGAVDIETKSFPEEKYTTVSVGFGYNPKMHFKNDALTYKGGSTDFLGFDDGTRALPFDKTSDIPDVSDTNGADAEVFTRKFTPDLSARETSNFMNSNFSFSHGNQIDKKGAVIGYNAIFNYRNTAEHYDDLVFGRYRKEPESDISALQPEVTRKGTQSINDAFWNALLTGAIKFGTNSISASAMRTQNGTSTAMSRISANQDDSPSILQEDVLTYTQRSVTSGVLIGKHKLNNIELEWRGALNSSRIHQPDFRDTRQQINEDGSFDLNTGVGAGVDRFYRDLSEGNQSFKVDLSVPYGEKNKFKFGGMAVLKQRDFEVLNYLFRNQRGIDISGLADDLLAPENIWTPETKEGIVVKGTFTPSNQYESSQNVTGAYAMTEMQVSDKLKAIYGVRAELVKMKYTGANQKEEVLTDSLVMDELDILPSVNLVYALNENMNLRGSFNRTLARPSFSEKSNAQIYDPISKITKIGNLDLEETHINNYDLRWEYFYSADEMFSISTFYKQFNGHIELVSFSTATDQIKPRNSGLSVVYGFEVEFRKNIMNNLSFGSNASLVKSEVDLHSVFVGEDDPVTGIKAPSEFETRVGSARTGESIASTRSMTGQSPFIINGYLNYKSDDNSLNANISYNVQGRALSIVGSGLSPDIYVNPFHSLNINGSKSFGKTGNSKITVAVKNILGAEKVLIYKSYGTDDNIFSAFKPGRNVSVKYTYTF